MTSTILTTPRRMGRHPDLYLSLGSISVGVIVLIYALTLPTMGDGRPGPGLFPGIISSALILCGLALALRTVVHSRRVTAGQHDSADADEAIPEEPTGDLDSGDAVPDTAVAGMDIERETVSTRRAWLNGVVMLASIVGYMVLAEPLGFIITMFLVTLVIMLLLKAKLISALVTSLALSFGMWLIFERGLQVQLPNGLLW